MNDLSNEIIKWSNDNFIKAFVFKKHNNNVSAIYGAFL